MKMNFRERCELYASKRNGTPALGGYTGEGGPGACHPSRRRAQFAAFAQAYPRKTAQHTPLFCVVGMPPGRAVNRENRCFVPIMDIL